MVMVHGEKMSKSLRNYIAVADALQRYSADVIRYALAAVHYRKPMEVDEARLEDAAKALGRLRIALASAGAGQARAGGGGPGGPGSRAPQRAAGTAGAPLPDPPEENTNTAAGLGPRV